MIKIEVKKSRKTYLLGKRLVLKSIQPRMSAKIEVFNRIR